MANGPTRQIAWARETAACSPTSRTCSPEPLRTRAPAQRCVRASHIATRGPLRSRWRPPSPRHEQAPSAPGNSRVRRRSPILQAAARGAGRAVRFLPRGAPAPPWSIDRSERDGPSSAARTASDRRRVMPDQVVYLGGKSRLGQSAARRGLRNSPQTQLPGQRDQLLAAAAGEPKQPFAVDQLLPLGESRWQEPRQSGRNR